MTWRRFFQIVVAVASIAAIMYLRDPSWMGNVTVGLRDWEQLPDGTRFRWTTGRSSSYVPNDATAMTLPMRGVFPGQDGQIVTVDIAVDDKWLATVKLPDPAVWVEPALPLEHRPTSRRFRRIDLHISRMVGTSNRGIQIGEVRLTRSGGQ